MSELTSRPLDPYTDAEQLIELFDQVFGFTVSPAMWYWKYVPPWATRYYCWVGLVGDEIIGYAGAVPLRGQLPGGESVTFLQVSDVMVHPDWRRKHDYFTPTYETLLADTEELRRVIYGFSDHRAFRLLERFGYSDLVEKAQTRFVRPRGRTKRFELREWEIDDPTIDALWKERGAQLGASLVRDTLYLCWRYRDHPANSYRVFGVFEGGSAVGWLLVGADTPGERDRPLEIPVVDMMLPEDAIKDAFESLAEHLDQPLASWLPRHIAPGFDEETDTDTNVYHYPSGCAAGTEMLRDNLFYTMGDVDWW